MRAWWIVEPHTGAVSMAKERIMTGYYIAPIIGAGTEDDPYRASIQDARVNYVAEIPTNARGIPISTWCVVQVTDTTDRPKLDVNGIPMSDVNGPIRETVRRDIVLGDIAIVPVADLAAGRVAVGLKPKRVIP